MPWYRVNGMLVHIKMTNTKKRPAPAPCCAFIPRPTSGFSPTNEVEKIDMVRCMGISTILCDWPVKGGTCDAPLCADHAQAIGPDHHLCPLHFAQQRAAEPELF